jgi:hypothetical protein
MTVTIELPPEREAALKVQAQALGLSIEQWLLRLAEQAGPAPNRAEEQCHDSQPIWEVITENMKHVPREDLAALPRDGASQIDHYVYGLPKRAE